MRKIRFYLEVEVPKNIGVGDVMSAIGHQDEHIQNWLEDSFYINKLICIEDEIL